MNKAIAALVATCCIAPALVSAQVRDEYSPRIQWQQPLGTEVTPIHVGLMPNGRLFFINNYNYFENPGMNLRMPGFEPEYVFVMDTTPAGVPPPASVMVQTLPNPSPLGTTFDAGTNILRFRTLACSGHTLTADGKVFFASGVDATVDMTLYSAGNLFPALRVDGIAETFTLDPASLAITRHADTLVPGPATGRPIRWYATVTRLADSRMLITGGYERVVPALLPNNSVEVYDPSTGAMSVVSTVAETPPGIENPDYPHVFQHPHAHGRGVTALVIGGSGEAMFLALDGASKQWVRTGKYRPGARELIDAAAPTTVFPNHGSSSAMLPIRLPGSSWGYGNGSVLQAGGWHHTRLQGQVDVYDPVADAWRPSISMRSRRLHPSTVILPDGRILILAGHDGSSVVEETGYAEYVDPRNGFALARGTAFMPEVRAYHTITVLLPDGRVLLGSGNVDHNDGREWTDFRYYSPDYMFKPRPALAEAPESISMGQAFVIAVPHGTRIGEAALVGLGSMTHSYDMNQRHVQLEVHDPQITMRSTGGRWAGASAGQCRADPTGCFDLHVLKAPPNPETAPRGHYMLFILDPDRVPSEGRILKLE